MSLFTTWYNRSMRLLMSIEPQAGIARIRAKAGAALWTAVSLLVAAFAADTFTTLAAGAAARLDDVNPLVRDASPAGYVLFSVLRLCAALALLLWFWPIRLDRTVRSRLLPFVLPFTYAHRLSYFGAALILVIPPVKLLAAASNLFLIHAGHPLFSRWSLAVSGVVAGVLLSNAMLVWRSREVSTDCADCRG